MALQAPLAETASRDDDRLRKLAFALRFVGIAFLVFFVIAAFASITKTRAPDPLYGMFGWGSQGDAEEVMISAIYVVWALFLWLAARDPIRHRLFIDFTLAANAAHFGVMFGQALLMPHEQTHLVGDVPIGWLLLVVLAAFWFPVRRLPEPS